MFIMVSNYLANSNEMKSLKIFVFAIIISGCVQHDFTFEDTPVLIIDVTSNSELGVDLKITELNETPQKYEHSLNYYPLSNTIRTRELPANLIPFEIGSNDNVELKINNNILPDINYVLRVVSISDNKKVYGDTTHFKAKVLQNTYAILQNNLSLNNFDALSKLKLINGEIYLPLGNTVFKYNARNNNWASEGSNFLEYLNSSHSGKFEINNRLYSFSASRLNLWNRNLTDIEEVIDLSLDSFVIIPYFNINNTIYYVLRDTDGNVFLNNAIIGEKLDVNNNRTLPEDFPTTRKVINLSLIHI